MIFKSYTFSLFLNYTKLLLLIKNESYIMEKLLELPNELVEMIFSFIPREALKFLTTVPFLANYANRSIFSSVVIDPDVKYTRPTEVFVDDYIPVIISPKELVAIAKSYGFFPKKIKFEEPYDALTLANQCPQYLKSAKIHLQIWGFDQEKKLERFIEEFKLNPFIVDTISNAPGNFGELDYDNPVLWELIKNVTSFIDTDKCYEVFNNIKSLTSLSIYCTMKTENVRLFPRQLKKLTCFCEGSNEQLPKFDNLLNLESLFFTYRILIVVNCFPKIDISLLSKLHTLELYQSIEKDCETNLPTWVLPASLKFLDINPLQSLRKSWNEMCPNLVKFYIRSVGRDWDNLLFSQVLKKEVFDIINTQRLIHLEMPTSLISDYGKRSKLIKRFQSLHPNRNLFSSPSSLETLILYPGYKSPSMHAFLDFESNRLKRLKEIQLLGVHDLNYLGTIPSSVVRAKLESVGINELLPFSFAINLVQLSLSDLMIGKAFSMSFSDSLKRLILTTSGIEKANIGANGLEYLNLERNDFRTLNDETLIIPQGLKELDLSNNKIDGVAMNLPPKLSVLKLNKNKIKFIKQVPMHLKTLECRDNELRSVLTKSNLPDSLTRLDFSANKIDDNWISTINLLELTGLKNLFLARNKLTVFDPSCLSDSLVELDLSKNRIASLTNLFQKLKNLNSINLLLNKLQGYFSNKRENKEDVFGENIRTIDVICNRLTRHDIIGLFTEISKKDKFERLDVEEELIPPLLKEADSRQRKMRRLD